MKSILTLVFVLSLTFSYSQRGGGGMGGGGMQQGGGSGQRGEGVGNQQRKMPEFNASQVAGIFKYDAEEVIKKIKLKKDKKLILNVSQAIANYNVKMDEIALLNKVNFDTLNVYVNSSMKSRRGQRGDRQTSQSEERQSSDSEQGGRRGQNDQKGNMRELIKEKIDPAKNAVAQEEQNLNKSLKTLLNEKQFEKWLKYQEKVKEENKPEEPSNNNQNQRQNGGGGMGGSSGGGGGGGMR